MEKIKKGFTVALLFICTWLYAQPAKLLYECENCFIREYYFLGSFKVISEKNNSRLLLMDKENIVSDVLKGVDIQKISIENDSVFHLMSSIYYAKINIKAGMFRIKRLVLLAPEMSEVLGYNVLAFNNNVMATSFIRTGGGKYKYCSIDRTVRGVLTDYPYLPAEILQRCDEVDILLRPGDRLFTFIDVTLTSEKRRKRGHRMYDFAFRDNALLFFDLNSNRFFKINEDMEVVIYFDLPEGRNWRYYNDAGTGKDYFIDYKKKSLSVFRFDWDSGNLLPLLQFQGNRISCINHDRLVYTEKNKKVHRVKVKYLKKKEEESKILELKEVIIRAKKNN